MQTKLWLTTALTAIVTASPAFGDTSDLERFTKAIEKSGVTPYTAVIEKDLRGAKVFCICYDTGNEYQFGYIAALEQSDGVQGLCTVPQFGAGGQVTGATNCPVGKFEILAK